jgi:hypothetical protein
MQFCDHAGTGSDDLKVRKLLRKMPSIWSHARIVVDIVSMKVFVWVLGQLFTWAVDPNGGILDSHLFFYDPFQISLSTTAYEVGPPGPTGSQQFETTFRSGRRRAQAGEALLPAIWEVRVGGNHRARGIEPPDLLGCELPIDRAEVVP